MISNESARPILISSVESSDQLYRVAAKWLEGIRNYNVEDAATGADLCPPVGVTFAFITLYGRRGRRIRAGVGLLGQRRSEGEIRAFLAGHGIDEAAIARGRLKITLATHHEKDPEEARAAEDSGAWDRLQVVEDGIALVRLADDSFEEFAIGSSDPPSAPSGMSCPCLDLSDWPSGARFKSRSFVEGSDGQPIEVEHARRAWPRLEPSMADAVRARCRLAGRWILRSQADNGGFRYLYDPVHDKTVGRYTVTGHAGAVLALAELGRQRAGLPFLDGALLGLKELRSRFQVDSGPSGSLHVDFGEGPSIGATAVTLQALTAIPDQQWGKSLREEARALGRFLLDRQLPDGGFDPGIPRSRKPGDGQEGRLYADAEAALALAWLSQRDSGARHHEAVAHALDALTSRPRSPEEALYQDAYLVRVSAAAYRLTRDPRYRHACMERARELSRDVPDAGLGRTSPRWMAGSSQPSMWSASAFAEAMVEAAELAMDGSGPVEELLSPALAAAQFLLEQQLDADTAYFTCSPRNAEGCFRSAPDNNLSCIGYVHGTVKALLATERVLRRAGGEYRASRALVTQGHLA